MRHRVSGRKLNRTSSHRKALFSNLANSLLKYEQIKTTLPKAKDLRSIVDKLITIGKKQNLYARRRIISILHNNDNANKLLDLLPKRYEKRQGGYTRVMKAGYRYGDRAPLAIIELVDRDPEARKVDIKPKDKEESSKDKEAAPVDK